MSASESKSAVVLALAEEFLERYRQGQRPSLREYAERHPELAAEIREVFPAMALMENIALADDSLEGEAAGCEPPPPAPLQQLGDFRLIREVGRGGMGVVYEAEQVSLGRHVALKVLSRKMLLDARHSRRFVREAKAAAKLHHTNIVPVFGVGEQDGLPYYVMQFIQGRGLDEVIEELRRLQHAQGPGTLPEAPRPVGDRRHPDVSAADVARSLLTGEFRAPAGGATADDAAGAADPAATPSEGRPPETSSLSSSSVVLSGQSDDSHKLGGKKPTYWQGVAHIGVQVAGALAHAHGQGVLHRDIKPSNLLLDLRGSVWVTDFGLAKADDQQDLTHTGDILGTLRYMPPEAFEGRSDRRGDVYALGLTLYELLALRPAFDEKDRHRLIKRVTTEEPARLERLNAQVPRDLVTIVHKAIDRDLHHRYASAGDLAADLQRFLDDEPIHARRISLVEQLLRWARRNRGVAAALSVVALLLVLLAVGALLAAARFQKLEQGQRALAEKNEKQALEMSQLANEKEGERAKAVEAGKETEAARKREAAQGREQRRNLYYAEMNLAGQAADSPSGIGRVGELLAPWGRNQPDLRGWEWYYLHGLGHRDLRTLRGHGDAVRAVAWNRDSRRLASAGWDGAVKVWEAATGREAFTFRGHAGPVNSVAWSPDGTRLASASWDGTVKVWEAATGKETLTLRGHLGHVESVAWSPDGTRLASAGGDGAVRVWETATGKQTQTLLGHSREVASVAWSPDGTRLASASDDRTIRVWEPAARKGAITLRGHARTVRCVAWSPDGSRLASASHDATVKVWDAATGKETLTLRGHTNPVWSVAWSPDGTRLASAGDARVKVWEAATGEESLILRGHTRGVWSVAWSPDGTRLASAGQDRTVKVFDARPGRVKPYRELRAADQDQTVKVFDAASGNETLTLRGHTNPVGSVAWSPDGTRLASGGQDAMVRVWDAASCKETRALRGHAEAVEAVAWSPDGTRLASAGHDGTVKVWDAATGEETRTLRGHAMTVKSVAWSCDGTRLASAGEDQTVKIWDATTGKEIRTLRGHTARVDFVAWNPDGTRLASASEDHTVKLWDTATGNETRALRGHADYVFAVAWSPDGMRLASDSEDGTLKLWDAATGTDTLTLRGHTNSVLSVAWSPDGLRLASASEDWTVKLWDAATGKETLTARGHTDRVLSVAWSADGTRLASAGADQSILIHDATMGYALERSDRLLPVLDRRIAADPQNITDRQLRAEIHARVGDWDRAVADVRHYLAQSPDRPRWYATDWWVVGPYPGDLKAKYPPENNPNPSRPVPGTATQAGTTPTRLPWQVVPRDGNGFVDVGALFDRAEHVSGYALMRVYSPGNQPVAIRLSSTNGVRLWLNGQLVHEKPAGHPATPDGDAVPATLEAGWNTLLAKVVNATGEHALYLRLSGEPADLAWASSSALIERGRWDEAERVVTEELEKRQNHAPTRALAERFYRQRADADAGRGEWTRLAADYAQLLNLRPEDHTLWYWAGTVLAELGEAPAYQKHRRAMLERFGTTEDPMIAERTAKVCLLLPADADELKRLGALAERAVTHGVGRAELPYFHLVRGLAEYQRGNPDAGEGWLRKALSANDSWNLTVPAHLILAMIQQQRGKPEEARESLARAVALFDRQAPRPGSSDYRGGWHDRLVCQVLRRQAEALLGAAAPASKN
jgi:WD40 repeat protein/serine/threonine protein kinase/tetratricopeptide (TPR) repeat protein